MFHVLVLGGMALAASGGATGVQGCGGSVGASGDAGPDTAGFPSETASYVDAAFLQDGGPIDGARQADGSVDAIAQAETSSDADAAGAPDVCFPQETALPLDAGCGK